ncbi:MAG: O-antigen/teichoic acid export membrane protein [Candidatus Poriferisodalaceae bacterium]
MLRLLTGSTIVRISGAIAQLMMVMAISRASDSETAGFVFFGYSILMISSTIARFGTELSGLRVAAQQFEAGDLERLRESSRVRVLTVAALGLATSVLLLTLGPLIAQRTFGPEIVVVIRWTALAIPAMTILGLISELLKGAGRAWLGLALQNSLVPILSTPVILIIAIDGAPTARSVALVIAVAAWIAALSAISFWLRTIGYSLRQWTVRSELSKREIAGLFREAPALLIVSATPVTMQWVGSILLGFLAAPGDVAGYSVAARISIAVSIVHSAAASVVGPQMAIAHDRLDSLRLRRLCIQTGLLITVLTLPILIAMLALSSPTMGLFGESYSDFDGALRILLAGQLFAAAVGHSGMVLVMAGKYSSARATSLVAAGSLAGFDLVLIPRYGASGAAAAMVGSVVLGHLAAVVLVRIKLKIWTFPTSIADISGALPGVRFRP